MSSCFLCGKPIPPTRYHLRRRVRVGELERKRFGATKAFATSSRFGYRVVCVGCAHAIDRKTGRDRSHGEVQLAMAFAVLFIVMFLKYIGVL